MFNSYSTYSQDLSLFDTLGLKPFKFDHATTNSLGTVDVDGSSVEVIVYGCPAMFWRFKISGDGENGVNDYDISTGSGSLSDFWPFIEQVCDNMIVVQSIP